MTYRDDQEALHQRVRELERDLERASQEAVGRKEAQAEAARLRTALAKAQRELERLRKPPQERQGTKRLAVIISVFIAIVGLGAAFFLVMVSKPTTSQERAALPLAQPVVPSPVPSPTPTSQPAERSPAEPLPRNIQRVVQGHLREVRYCYERDLVVDPHLEGMVAVKITIGRNGKVTAAQLERTTTLQRSSVQTCILAAVRTWLFPEGGEPITVVYPFVLKAGR